MCTYAALFSELVSEPGPHVQVDAFVEVSVRDGRSLSTKTVWDDKNPEFDEVLTFIVDDPRTQSIKAFLKEHDIAFQKVTALASGSASLPCRPPYGALHFIPDTKPWKCAAPFTA